MPDKTNELIHHGEAQQLYNDLRRRAASADENLAPYYDATQTYVVGKRVMYKDDLYECKTAITTPEAWTAAHWIQRSVADALEESIDKASNVVIVSNTQPQGEQNNKIWIQNAAEEEYTIPTYEEFDTIKSAINELPTEETGEALLEEETERTVLEEYFLDTLDRIFTNLPQDDAAGDILAELTQENLWLDMLQRELEARESA